MRRGLAIIALGLAALGLAGRNASQTEPVTIRVDTTATRGPMYPFWAWFGHDEPNYTYTPNGMKLLSALQDAQPRARVHARPQPADVRRRQARAQVGLDQRLHRGRQRASPSTTGRSSIGSSTRTRTRGMKPFVQLGFMPEALSSAPAGMPYRHFWKPGDPYNDIYTGWTYAPKDYRKWEELCYRGDAALRREVRPRGGRELVVRALERAGHRLLERLGRAGAAAAIRWRRRRRRRGATSSTSSTTSPSRACAAPCRRRRSAARK